MLVIHLIRKPLSEGNVASNVLKWGCGALNIDASRIGADVLVNPPAGNVAGTASPNMSTYGMPRDVAPTTSVGRWPANLVLSCHPEHPKCCPVADLNAQVGITKGAIRKPTGRPIYDQSGARAVTWNPNDVLDTTERGYTDEGGPSRYFKQVREG